MLPERRLLRSFTVCLLAFTGVAVLAGPQATPRTDGSDPDVIVVTNGTPPCRPALDTVWVADWSFDGTDSTCDESGWQKFDNYVQNDGTNDWTVNDRHSGQGFITGRAAELRRHDLCWVQDGYGNNWDAAVVLRYRGAGSTLSIDYRSDSEPDFDFVSIEADSLCRSNTLATAAIPPGLPQEFRRLLFSTSGPNLAGRVTAQALPDFGLPDSTHCVYVRFTSDGVGSDSDGGFLSTLGAGLVVDNIVVTGDASYAEDFAGTSLDPHVTLVNAAPAAPYGTWARLVHHPQDLDPANEDSTCAWVFGDPAFVCNPAWPPCVRPLADNSIVSPWVPLTGPGGTVLSFREWPSQASGSACTIRQWSVRTLHRIANSDTQVPDDSLDCVGGWKTGSFGGTTSNSWRTVVADISARVPPGARAVQVRFRVTALSRLIGHPPTSCGAAPGPYLDRVRIARVVQPTDAPPEQAPETPRTTTLHPSTPNPFNPTTRIRFDLAHGGPVELVIHDVAGRQVRTLIHRSFTAGSGYETTWDGTNAAGRRMASGVYLCRLSTADGVRVQRLVLLD